MSGFRACVRGLATEVKEAELRELASKCGRVTQAEIMLSEFDGSSRGLGYVTMATAEELAKLVRTYHNAMWRGGRKLRIESARPDFRERLRLEREVTEAAERKRRERAMEKRPERPPSKAPLNGMPRPKGNKIYLSETALDTEPPPAETSVGPSEDRHQMEELSRSIASEESLSLSIFHELLSKSDKAKLGDSSFGKISERVDSKKRRISETVDDRNHNDNADSEDARRQWTALRDVFSTAPLQTFAGGLALSFAAAGGRVEHKFNFTSVEPSQPNIGDQPASTEDVTPSPMPGLWTDLDAAIDEGRRFVRDIDVDAVETRWEQNRVALTRSYRRMLRKMQARKRRRTF